MPRGQWIERPRDNIDELTLADVKWLRKYRHIQVNAAGKKNNAKRAFTCAGTGFGSEFGTVHIMLDPYMLGLNHLTKQHHFYHLNKEWSSKPDYYITETSKKFPRAYTVLCLSIAYDGPYEFFPAPKAIFSAPAEEIYKRLKSPQWKELIKSFQVQSCCV